MKDNKNKEKEEKKKKRRRNQDKRAQTDEVRTKILETRDRWMLMSRGPAGSLSSKVWSCEQGFVNSSFVFFKKNCLKILIHKIENQPLPRKLSSPMLHHCQCFPERHTHKKKKKKRGVRVTGSNTRKFKNKNKNKPFVVPREWTAQ